MCANLIRATVGCTVALLTGGCLAPWAAPVLRDEVSKRAKISTAPPSNSGPASAPLDPGSPQPDMAAVIDKIQLVRAMDPAAEQKLLDELRRVPPSTWPLVAEQFRASLAYHEQLVEKSQTAPRETQPVVDLRRALRTDAISTIEPRQVAATGLVYEQGAASIDDRPSATIGSLADPRRANPETVPILARSTPYPTPDPISEIAATSSEPKTPARFSGDGPMYPIAARSIAATDSAARQNAAGESPHGATQAVAQAIAEPSSRQAALEEVGKQAQPLRLPATQSSADANNWQQLIQKAIVDLNHHVSESPTTTAEVHQHVSLRILRLLAGDTEQAMEPIPHSSPAEQDYWSQQLFALATYLDHHSQPDDKRRAAAAVTHLDEAVSSLRELGSLSLRNLSFCKNVYGYGAFDPYDSDTFAPCQHVSLYVEIENYHSTSSEKGFCTSLGTTYEMLDEKGNRVTSGDFPDVNDCCRSRRRDFHIQFGLTLPENIAPGHYQLQLVVKDRQSDKIGNAKVPFEIRGGKK